MSYTISDLPLKKYLYFFIIYYLFVIIIYLFFIIFYFLCLL